MKNNNSKKGKVSVAEVVSEKVKAPESVTPEVRERQHHHSGGVFGAFLLISIGLVLLFNNLGILPWEVWGHLWKFWPLLLIVSGLQLVFGRNWFSNLVVSVIGIFVVLAIISFSIANVNETFKNWSDTNIPFWKNVHRMMVQNSREVITNLEVQGNKYQNLISRKIKIDIGSATFSLGEETSDALLKVSATHPENSGKPRIRESLVNNILTLDFDITSQSGMFFFDTARREYDLSLGQPSLQTSISLDLGSGLGKFDFSKSNLKDINVEMGSGELNISFSENIPTGDFSIKVGSGNVNVDLPGEVGFVIHYKIGSGSLKIGTNSIRGEGTFTSLNSDTAPKKIEINLEIGSGNAQINN